MVDLPEDAGENADGLRAIMERFHEPWPAWISCGPGWYPILIALDQRLSSMIPGYEVQQIKEKFGTLRFYWSWPEETPEESIEEGEHLERAAEQLSARMCETCGSGGGRRVKQNGFWIKTLCHRCSP